MNCKRPSSWVLACTAVLLVAFALRGDLAVGETAHTVRRPEPPAVVHAERPPRPQTAASRLEGTVFDALGFRLVGAEVALTDGQRVRTDADGRFSVRVPEQGGVDLLVSYADHQPMVRRAFAAAIDPWAVALEPRAPWDPTTAAPPSAPPPLRGEGLLRDADGKPVQRALVTVVETGALARSDELGRYAVELPAGPATLVATATGIADDRGLAAKAEPFAPPRPRGLLPLPDLVLGPGCMLRGTVRDPQGHPVAGVPLRVTGAGVERLVEATQNGVWRVTGLLPGRYTVSAFAWRGALGGSQAVDVDGPVRDCEVALRATRRCRLQVVHEDGAPVARAYVASSFAGVRRGLAQADAQGFAELATVDAGPEFEVRAAGRYEPLRVQRFEAERSRLVVLTP